MNLFYGSFSGEGTRKKDGDSIGKLDFVVSDSLGSNKKSCWDNLEIHSLLELFSTLSG
jgi:hypothetical protein